MSQISSLLERFQRMRRLKLLKQDFNSKLKAKYLSKNIMKVL